MGSPADPWFARPDPKKRERGEWFEDVARAGRDTKQTREAHGEALEPLENALRGANAGREDSCTIQETDGS